MEHTHTNTIIIGAGAAGLACAACLSRKGIPFILLEQDDHVAKQWNNRYDRLHLHTPRNHSGLPYFKIPVQYPKYLSKNDFADYLEQYANAFQIKPFFQHKVISVSRKKDKWEIVTDKSHFLSGNVIVATGYARKPIMPPSGDTENFSGEIIHSVDYKNGGKFTNRKVLVVGFGNSACEIAICLHEHQAFPALSVRSAVNIIPRDIAGIPVVSIAIAQQWLTRISATLTDLINRPVLQIMIGSLKKSGLKKLPYGPMEQIVKYKKIPLIDIGTLALIKKSKIKVYPGILNVTGDTIEFTNGAKDDFDAIVFATGYEPGLTDFLDGYQANFHENPANPPNLYFCGFNITPTGMLREIGIEAKRIVKHIVKSGGL